MARKQKTRLEHDFLGEKEIPDSVYYGVQTLGILPFLWKWNQTNGLNPEGIF